MLTDGVEILIAWAMRLELIKDLGRCRQMVAGLYGSDWTLAARTALATRGWRQSPMWIFAPRTPIGPFPIMMSASCTTARSPITGLMRRQMERKGHRFMSSCDSELSGGLHGAQFSQLALTLEASLAGNSIDRY